MSDLLDGLTGLQGKPLLDAGPLDLVLLDPEFSGIGIEPGRHGLAGPEYLVRRGFWLSLELGLEDGGLVQDSRLSESRYAWCSASRGNSRPAYFR